MLFSVGIDLAKAVLPTFGVHDLIKAKYRDKIPGGKADKLRPSAFPKDALEEGTKHELEHTRNRAMAREIAMDHLAEDVGYYKKLRRIEKAQCVHHALVIYANDICKARIGGALGSRLTGGKHGKLVLLLTNEVRHLKSRDVGREAEIFQYYRTHNIPFLYVQPGKTVTREVIDERAEVAKRGAVTAPPKKTPNPPLPTEIITELDLTHVDGGIRSALDVLRERVANWTKPKDYEHAVDPRARAELAELIKKRRSLGVSRRGFAQELDALRVQRKRGWKGKVRAIQAEQARAATTYEEAGRRVRAILGPQYATAGGGFDKVDNRTVAAIEGLPYPDIGFHPASRPMSYLLSVGWHNRGTDKKTGEPINVFSKREFDALMFEYGRFVGRIASQFVSKYAQATGEKEYTADSTWGNRKRTATYRNLLKTWTDEAQSVLWDLARNYAPKDTPSEGSNFAVYAHVVLPKRLIDSLREASGKAGEAVFLSELESMPERGGRKLTPVTRLETPDQTLYREEVESKASDILRQILPPIELAVVCARLNILNRQQDGSGAYVPRKGRSLTIDVGSLRSFNKVKTDIITNLPDFIEDASQRAKVEKVLSNASPKYFESIFSTAMRHIAERTDETDPEELRIIAELANMKRVYLEGIRHQVWRRQDPETYREGGYIGKLVTHPDPVDPKELAALEKEHATLTAKINRTVEPAAVQRLLDERLQVSRKVVEMRGRAARHYVPPEGGRRVQKPLVSDKAVRQFWTRNLDLASGVGVDVDFYAAPNISMPNLVEGHKARALAYYRLVEEFRRHTPAKLQRLIAEKTPVTFTEGGITHHREQKSPEQIKYRGVTFLVPQEHIKALLEHVANEKLVGRGRSVAKSFVILNARPEVEALWSECRLWQLNGL